MRVGPGLRVGLWRPSRERYHHPFIHLGFYSGPELGDIIVGSKYEQPLLEGVVCFSVGVLFRPDLGKRQRLETILILETYHESMWEYETWMKVQTG